MISLLILLVVSSSIQAYEWSGSPDNGRVLILGLPGIALRGGGGEVRRSQQRHETQAIDIRGALEAQDIDIRPVETWWQMTVRFVSSLCCGGRRSCSRAHPPRLERQLSYYPGRQQ